MKTKGAMIGGLDGRGGGGGQPGGGGGESCHLFFNKKSGSYL